MFLTNWSLLDETIRSRAQIKDIFLSLSEWRIFLPACTSTCCQMNFSHVELSSSMMFNLSKRHFFFSYLCVFLWQEDQLCSRESHCSLSEHIFCDILHYWWRWHASDEKRLLSSLHQYLASTLENHKFLKASNCAVATDDLRDFLLVRIVDCHWNRCRYSHLGQDCSSSSTSIDLNLCDNPIGCVLDRRSSRTIEPINDADFDLVRSMCWLVCRLEYESLVRLPSERGQLHRSLASTHHHLVTNMDLRSPLETINIQQNLSFNSTNDLMFFTSDLLSKVSNPSPSISSEQVLRLIQSPDHCTFFQKNICSSTTLSCRVEIIWTIHRRNCVDRQSIETVKWWTIQKCLCSRVSSHQSVGEG